MIEVRKLQDHEYEVTVTSHSTTRHKVTITPEYGNRLTGGVASDEQLLEQSFRFLLDREPNTSILSTFELPVISRYFPEYETEIVKMLR